MRVAHAELVWRSVDSFLPSFHGAGDAAGTTAHRVRQRGRVARADPSELLQELDRAAQGGDNRPAAVAALEMPSYAAQLEILELLFQVVRKLLSGSAAFPRASCADPTHEPLDAALRRHDASIMIRGPSGSLLTPSHTAGTTCLDEAGVATRRRRSAAQRLFNGCSQHGARRQQADLLTL